MRLADLEFPTSAEAVRAGYLSMKVGDDIEVHQAHCATQDDLDCDCYPERYVMGADWSLIPVGSMEGRA